MRWPAVALIVCCCSDATGSEVELPMPRQSSSITVRAGQANWWREGSYEVWVLRDDCEIAQAGKIARAQEAVLWVARAEPLSGQISKILAYLEGQVSVETIRDGPAHRLIGRSADRIQAGRWFGRFYTSTAIEIEAPVTGFEPKVKPAIYRRGVDAREVETAGRVQPAQFSTTVPGYIPEPPAGTLPELAPPSVLWPAPGSSVLPPPLPPHEAVPAPPPSRSPAVRSIMIRSRSNVRMQGKVFPSPDGRETIAVVTSGVNVVVDGLESIRGLTDGKIDVEADRIVIWTAPLEALDLSGQASGERLQPKDTPLEFYLEGNIVFREGDRVIYAERMYYNVPGRYGIVLNAEVLTPAPGYQGLIRLKADVLQQLDEFNFQAFGAAVTSSRIGVPRYWVQAEQVTFQDVQTQRSDPFTGQLAFDPITQEPAVEHQYLATSRNNFLFAGGLPVLYWPVLATDLEKPNFYVDSLGVRNDDIFGFQVLADWDVYQLLGVQNRPQGTNWTISTDWLSYRGFGFGTRFKYNRFGFLTIPGPVRGLFDFWGIQDGGVDNLGRGRRAVIPTTDQRGRILWQHRHYLADGFQVTGELGLISDNNFLEEYYEREWNEWKDQITGIEFKRYVANSSWNLRADVRVNDFVTQTEWLPRFHHFLLGQQVFENLTWYAHSHIGYARLRTADLPPPPNEPANAPLPWEVDSLGLQYEKREGLRTATRHELDLPLPVGPLKIVPYVLGELAYWQEDVDRLEVSRAYGQAGIRGRLPFWSANPEVRNVLFNLNGLAHKVVLDADFFWADADEDLGRLPLYDPLTDDSNEHFQRRFLDDLYGGTAGLPPQYDSRYYALRTGMQSWVTAPGSEIADDLMVARVGIRQRLQTKRGMPGQERIIDWIVFDVEGSFFPEQDRDNFGEVVGLVNYAFRWHIGDRVTMLSDGFFDTFPGGLQTVSVGGVITRPLRGRMYLGYQLMEGPFSSNLIHAAVSYRMSEKWIFDARGTLALSSQSNTRESISFTRVGESVLVRLGVNLDQSRDSFGVAFAIEPRFLPGRLSHVGGVPIPPVGAFGLE
jgi:hypothetical protein